MCSASDEITPLQTTAVVLDKHSEIVDLSKRALVYPQNAEFLSFEEFKASRINLPYQQYTTPNFGKHRNGVWLYSELDNKSLKDNWVLNLDFSQLDTVDIYLLSDNELSFQQKGGRSVSSHYYRTPTFRLNLEANKKHEVYLYIKAKHFPIVAPTTLMQEQAHQQKVLFDYLFWGVFYGALLVIALYCIAVLVDKREFSALMLFGLVSLVFMWQVVWSGHTQLLPDSLHKLAIFQNFYLLLPLICIAASLFTLTFLPKPHASQAFNIALKLLCIPLLTVFTLILMDIGSDDVQIILVRFVGALTIVINLVVTIQVMSDGYKPANTILCAWIFLALGSIISSLFVVGVLPINLFTAYSFQGGLLALTLCFILGVILKIRYGLELEVKQASSDAQNNFLLIEEQNVHLDIARREAIKASEIKSQFLANMSHEIRTPLNAIIGFSKELQEKSSEAERHEHVKIINSAATDLLTIVNDILDFSKMEAGKLTLTQKPFSPRDALEDIAALMAKSSHLKQLEFIFDVAPLPAVLIGDSFKIKQLLSNLLSNALKFTNFGHITLRARFFTFGDDECMLTIEVEDSGIGINDEDKKKLFKPFNQIDDDLNRSFQGTGLGLVICQELAFLMKGSIEVESVYSQGSKFSVNLPFDVVNNQLAPTVLPRYQGKSAAILDPNPVTRKITCSLLREVGLITSSYESVELFEQHTSEYEKQHGSALFDFAFISLSLCHIKQRTSLINRVKKVHSKKIILLFSGPAPEKHQIGSNLNKPVVIRAPLTYKNLLDLGSTPVSFVDRSSKSQLKSLPAARVLATDDMELNLRLLDTWLKDSSVTLELATSGAEAVDLCNKYEYDLIFMDIQMPNMDGLEATKRIRKTELNVGTPIVAITAHAFPEEKERFLASGMDDYLPKPVNLDSLVQTIKSWCQGCDLPNQESKAIDWNTSVAKANGDEEGAKVFLDGFVEILPDTIAEIESLWQQQDFDKLQACVHKLHGACAYTGAQNLQKLCYETESNLKRNQTQHIKKLISSILLEAESVMEQWQQMRTNGT
ncbi:response regulator [Glaciecola sp. MH2013]|uniref:hybrid sensor histidine kinase/response regulator n=1 Tax=Glaciecola sp. MH2013 TaxID=2785524 RepID=UPI00189D6A12|nr:hybrid sensor histidine kinase/response regulator [Glaciecola sp. MH2013]MBF7073755.1 response regulator [Glaciecola sp. MH2013]